MEQTKNSMIPLSQLSGIRSRATEKILEFYRASEAECENAPLSPWHNGRKLKSSEIYVQMQLLTERIQLVSAENQGGGSGQINNNGGKAETNGSPEQGQRQTPLPGVSAPGAAAEGRNRPPALGREDIHRFDEQKTKHYEPWEKIFGGKALRIIFKGGAGSGKSFSLGQEVRERLVKARAGLENFNYPLSELEIPIVIKAGSLVASNHESIDDVIIGILNDSPKSSSSQLNEWLKSAFQTGSGRRLFIVIDGLDELPETSQTLFRKRMQQLDALESASLVVSCRTAYFDERQYWVSWGRARRAQVVELAPLEEQHQAALIKKLVCDNENSADSLRRRLKKNYTLNHFCRTPLILTSTCLLYTDGWLSETTNYASLYKTLTKRILSGDWKDLAERPEWTREPKVLRDAALQDRIGLLPSICWNLFEASPSENRFTFKQWREAFKKASRNGYAAALDSTLLLNELECVGMVIEAGYDTHHDQCYSFIHRTILEYFAARGLVDQHEKVWIDNLIKHIWCESEWVEVIRFAASMIDDSTFLLKRIAEETGPPSGTAKKDRLLQLSDFCDKLRDYLLFFFCLILVLIGITIGTSEAASNDLKEYVSLLTEWFPTAMSEAFRSFLTQPGEAINLLRNEFLKFYEFIFLLLYNETLTNKGGPPWNSFVFVSWVEFLVPYLAISIVLSVIASFITGRVKKFVYRGKELKQDDIFRTGLRVQAEVIGQTNNVSRAEMERVIDELLASESGKTPAIHGAAEEGGLPDNLLQLTGSNTAARRMLCDRWLSVIDKRCDEIKKVNRRYYRSIFLYKKILDKVSATPRPSLFKAADLRRSRLIKYYLRSPKRDITKYISEKLRAISADTTNGSEDAHLDVLVRNFNKLLDDPSLYNKEQFMDVYLRTETRHLLKQHPSGEKLRRLNRLLLEDAYPRQMWYFGPFEPEGTKRRQRRWLQPIRWFVRWKLRRSMSKLNNFSKDSDVFRALRGLYLLSDKRIIASLKKLLKQRASIERHLSYLKGWKPDHSFNYFDIYTAKALASMEDPYGRKKLEKFANGLDKNESTPLAIKELSMFDEKRAIELAAYCFKTDWSLDRGYAWRVELRDVLLSLPFERVAAELVRLCKEDIGYFRKVFLVEFLTQTNEETARKCLEKIAGSSDGQISEIAREVLKDGSNRFWTDPENWIAEQIDRIRNYIDKKEFDSAANHFNGLISCSMMGHSYGQGQSVLINNLEKVASVCSRELLEAWRKNHARHGEMNNNLVLLAKEPTGEVVRDTLIAWAEKCAAHKWFNSDYVDNRDDDHLDYNIIKKFLLLALGDLGEGPAETALLKMLYKAREGTTLLWRKIDGASCDPRLFVALGKIGSDTVLHELEEELKYSHPPILNYVVARLCAERNDPRAIEFLIKGERSGISWKNEFGPELELRELAIQFGARITKVYRDDRWRHEAISQSRNVKYPLV